MAVGDIQKNRKVRARIITSDPATRRIEAQLADGVAVQVAVYEVPTFFRWPLEGEIWTLTNMNGLWTLGDPMETGFDDPFPVENLAPGEAKVASETIYTSTGRSLVHVNQPDVADGSLLVWRDAGGGAWVPEFVEELDDPRIPPLGTIFPYAGPTVPGARWLLCDGSEKPVATYTALDALLGTTYGARTNGSGGAGSTHFRLPDLRGRVPVGVGTHTDVDTLGEHEGATLANRTPKHSHTVNTAGSHSHGGGTGGQSADHAHNIRHTDFPTGGGPTAKVFGPLFGFDTTAGVGGATVDHSHAISADGSHTHTVGVGGPADGPGFLVLNHIIRCL